MLWKITPRNSKSGVIGINVFNFTKKGENDLIVARNDTSIEVYINMAPKGSNNPIFELRGSIMIEESITNLESAYFGPIGKPEVIVTTYSGKVYGITDEESGGMEEIGDVVKMKKIEEKEVGVLEKKIQKLEQEVDKAYNNQPMNSNVRK